MLSPPTRRSPRQTRKSIGAAGSMPGTPTRRENAPLQPSPLRNELASASKSRKRARSLGGAGIDDPTAPPSAKQTNPRKKRMTIAPSKGILKKAMGAGGILGEDVYGGHTVIGIFQEALKEEKAREEETESDVAKRRELRKSLNRRVSFASHATIRLFPQQTTPNQTPSPKKGVGFSFDGSPSTDGESTGELSPYPQAGPHTPSPPAELPKAAPAPASILRSDEDETSMDIADDNLTLPLPSALIKRQLQRGVGFMVEDGDDSEEEQEMDMTEPFGNIIPPRDGVNRFLNTEDDDQTMDFTQVYPSHNVVEAENDTMGMEFTKVVGKIQGMSYSVGNNAMDKENRPPPGDNDVTMDMTRAVGTILPSSKAEDDTQPMDMTTVFPALQTPRHNASITPESSPFVTSPRTKSQPQPQTPPLIDAEIVRSPLSSGITGTPKRTPSKGLLALDLLTGKPLTSMTAPLPQIRRKSDSGVILGSPKAARRLSSRKSLGGIEEFKATASTRRLSLGRSNWHNKEFGIAKPQEDIKDMIALLTPKKPKPISPSKLATPNRTPRRAVDELMLTPRTVKREFGPKVANLVKVWEDHQEEEDGEGSDFPIIRLEEFLAMTNISFLDGLGPTSRRRTTIRPENMGVLQKPQLGDFARAGAVSIPMLELYQFSCQNASKYIEEGKAMIEGIEQDTLEDPPLLFREYVGAPPDLKRIMDMQFKLVKTWARLKAKGGWYTWRDQLIGGVMPTLTKNAEGLRKDKSRLTELRGQLEPFFPRIKEQHEEVKKQLEMLRNQREEIESADQEELRLVREEISIVSEGLETRRADMQIKEREAAELASEEAELRKQIEECRVKITRAERVKEMNRGFEKDEVECFRETLECLKFVSGWEVTSVNGSTIKLAFGNMNVTFEMNAFGPGGTATVEMVDNPDPIHQFTSACLRGSVLKGDVQKILNTISRTQHLSALLRTELALIKSKYPITVSVKGSQLIIDVCLLLSAARTKFHLTFTVSPQFFSGHGVAVHVERKYGDIDIAQIRKTVEGRVGSGGVQCMRGACEEVWEVWD